MIDQKIVDYVHEMKEKGFKEEQIREKMKKYGYTEGDVDYAFLNAGSFKMPPPALAELPKRPASVSVLSLAHILGGIAVLTCGALLEVSGPSYFGFSLDVSDALIIAVSASMMIIGIFNVYIGGGLWRLKRWARTSSIVLSMIGIVTLPLLFILFSKDTKKAFYVD